MARYQKILTVVDDPAVTIGQIQQLMGSKRYKYEKRGGQHVFRKGDGFWVLARFMTISYYGNFIHLDAWVENMGIEMDLEGFLGCAAKNPLKKLVAQVEEILTRPGLGYVPRETPVTVSAEAFCARCGTALVAGGKFCPKCAHPVGMPVPAGETLQIPTGTTKREYLKKYAGADFARRVKGAAIMGYVCAGINAVVCLIMGMPFGLIESAILLGLSLGMHLGKSKGCAIGILAYSVFSMVLGVVLYGSVGGWLWVLTGIFAVINFVNAEKKFKELTAAPVQPYNGTYGQ